MKIKNYDIAIVGAGIAGRTLAVLLAQHNFSVALIDKNEIQTQVTEAFGLRVSAINHSSRQLFQEVSVWDDIVAKRLTAYTDMHIWNNDGEVDFSAKESGQESLGFIIENQVILASLAEAIEASTIHCYQAEPLALNQFHDSAQVLLDSDERLQAKLIVGADGANSWVRKTLGVETKKRSYGHTAIVATIKTEHPHQHAARQRFTKTGPIAFLPLPDEHHCSIVWSQDKEKAEQLLGMSNEYFEKTLTEIFEGQLGEVTLASERRSFPLVMRHAADYIDNRVALVGDAIHTIHPLAGLGLNLGLNDVKCLGDNLIEAKNKNKDFANLLELRRYQRQRKSENVAVLAAMDGFHQLFNHKSQAVDWLRNKGLNATNKLGWLKNSIIKAATNV